MTLVAGTRLAAYEILAPLGAGGMGEVYRATDTRLGRDVAVKVVARRLMDDPDALARFEREARAVAALSHPNILALYDVGQEQDVVFAVMELLEGEPLHRRLASEDVSWKAAIEIAAAVADGLASAHARGIVHHDLKPANIFLTHDGLVKIVDFGLATQDPFLGNVPAAASARPGDTAADAVFGTVGYVSPEQVNGESTDQRTDIFSLGCVLYEMLSGEQAFRGDTPAETVAAILGAQPPESSGNGRTIPPRADAVVRRCLEKNPNHRFQSARDLAFALRGILIDSAALPSPARTRRLGPLRQLAAVIAVGLLAVAGGLWFDAPAAVKPPLPAAYDAYVRGRHAWSKRTEADLRDAIRFFQASIDADPTYAPAYAGMADGYGQLGYGSFISPEDAFPRARAAARKALTLDPALAEAHASLGFSLMYYDWNFSEAEAEYRRAIQLNPNDPNAHQWYAYLLTAMERPFDQADREMTTARDLDPLSVPINIDRAYILHYYGRNDEALQSVSRALEMNPRYPAAYFWRGRIYTSERRYADAEAALQQIGPLLTWTPAMAARGFLYARSGRTQEARTVLADFEQLSRQGRYASRYAAAVIYAGLGDREQVFSQLEAAYRERSHWLVWLKRDPRWNDVRADARFQALVRRIGLPSWRGSALGGQN